MYRTDDPVADFLRYDAEQQRKLKEHPVCCECGEHIQTETAYRIDGDWVCDYCMEQHREAVF